MCFSASDFYPLLTTMSAIMPESTMLDAFCLVCNYYFFLFSYVTWIPVELSIRGSNTLCTRHSISRHRGLEVILRNINSSCAYMLDLFNVRFCCIFLESISESVVEPLNDKNRLPYYHRKLNRVPEIDECGVNDKVRNLFIFYNIRS